MRFSPLHFHSLLELPPADWTQRYPPRARRQVPIQHHRYDEHSSESDSHQRRATTRATSPAGQQPMPARQATRNAYSPTGEDGEGLEVITTRDRSVQSTIDNASRSELTLADEPIPDYANPKYADLDADELFSVFYAEERAANPLLREYDMVERGEGA